MQLKRAYYPVVLNLKGREVIVAGGGRVSLKKVKKLLQSVSRIRIFSPVLEKELRLLVNRNKLVWYNRSIRKSDIKKASLVISATNKKAVNRLVSIWAKAAGIPVNVVDDASLSDFISPATFTLGKAVVAVHTNGSDPVLSRDMKNFLKEHWGEFLSYRKKL